MEPFPIRPRSDWGARQPTRDLVPFDPDQLDGIVGHWPGDRRNLAGLDPTDLLRSWQEWHINGRRWKDIGYNYAVDWTGTIWECRGWNVGGHVLGDENAKRIGVLFMVGMNEPMSDAMRDAGAALYAYLHTRAGRRLELTGHCDWAAKECPGPDVLAWIRAGAPHTDAGIPLVATTPPDRTGTTATPPAFPLARCDRHDRMAYFGPRSGPDHSVSGYHGHRDDLRTWGARMAWRGWRITPDGLYGPEHERVARAFQREKGLAVDGLIGPDTWAAAWTAPLT